MGCTGSSDSKAPPKQGVRPEPAPERSLSLSQAPDLRSPVGGSDEKFPGRGSASVSSILEPAATRQSHNPLPHWVGKAVFGPEFLTPQSAVYQMQFKETHSGHSGGFVLRRGRQKASQIEADGSDESVVIQYTPMEIGVGGLYRPRHAQKLEPGELPTFNPLPGKELIATVEMLKLADQEIIVDICVDEKRRMQLRWIDHRSRLQIAAYDAPYPGHMDPITKPPLRDSLPRFLVTAPTSMGGAPYENFNRGTFDLNAAPPRGPQQLLCKVRPQLDRSIGLHVQGCTDIVLLAGVLAARLMCQ
eukprot:TRINITY_DN7629_c0_g1_i1.p1 TRINITY_DN7629_c0_g1~~TRINITY_DN7629_c0_g1_i1.p1  ORF type:complete len:302 (+),score=54.87 TRINITY_DN7629_c0_g1_i1:257-1162(+)